jgi:hypothetical protein
MESSLRKEGDGGGHVSVMNGSNEEYNVALDQAARALDEFKMQLQDAGGELWQRIDTDDRGTLKNPVVIDN